MSSADPRLPASGLPVGTVAVEHHGASGYTANDGNSDTVLATLFEGCALIKCPGRLDVARNRIQQVYEDYLLHSPRPAALHILVRLRVLSALANNAARMGVPPEGLCRDDSISLYNLTGPPRPGVLDPHTSSPLALQPTPLQRTVLHHPWIDLFPFPRLRDNVLLGMEAGRLDDDELCADILEVKDEDLSGKPSLIVWGESWDWTAWEANDAFFRKWGFLARGCPELLEATNRWRAKRGEKKVVFEV
ncbi:hypothetical protein EsH8_III_000158 [Colletotrichum jinshuiense]